MGGPKAAPEVPLADAQLVGQGRKVERFWRVGFETLPRPRGKVLRRGRGRHQPVHRDAQGRDRHGLVLVVIHLDA